VTIRSVSEMLHAGRH